MDPLPVSDVISPPLVETPNPNDALERAPGDPTISLNADGTVANTTVNPVSMTVPVNPVPDPHVSDPAHVPSSYQAPEALAAGREAARLREEALQAENRWRVDRTPNAEYDRTPHVDPVPEGTWATPEEPPRFE